MELTRAPWRKSTYSSTTGGNCVEVATAWRKSTYSSTTGGECIEVATWRKASYSSTNGGECIEVGTGSQAVAVRDSKNPDGPRLAFSPEGWMAFTRRIKTGAPAQRPR